MRDDRPDPAAQPVAVLVVDDDADHATIVRRTLTRHQPPYHVDHAPDGMACLEALRRRPYALVLLDYTLPRLNGLEVLNAMRQEGLTTPVVMVTAQGNERIAVDAMKAGAMDYVVKTTGYFTTLPTVLDKVLRQHALAEENQRLFDEARTQRARLARILDSVTDGVLFLDLAGRVMSANRQAGLLLDVEPAAALGAGLADILGRLLPDPEDGQAVLAPLLRRRDEVRSDDHGDLALDGDRTLTWSAQPTHDAAGTVIGVTLTVRDVTREREVDRMKSDFVSFVTHQLRTPLSGIKWMLELAGDEPGVPEPAASYVQDAAEAAERLITLVNDLLDISRLESGRLLAPPESTDPAEVIAGVVDELRPLIDAKALALTVKLDPVAPVLADPQLFRQAVLNLVSNAVKYTPAGGRIAVRLTEEADGLHYEVRDSGIGVPRAAQRRLFEKFFRAENAYAVETEGTGLGLYLVRLIAAHMGGSVTCESSEGRGSTFTIQIPRRD